MITVYSMPKCGHCNTLKAYLKEKNIPYTLIDCSVEKEKALAIVNKTNQYAVPITVINEGSDDEKYLIGFQRESFEEFLTQFYKQ